MTLYIRCLSSDSRERKKQTNKHINKQSVMENEEERR